MKRSPLAIVAIPLVLFSVWLGKVILEFNSGEVVTLDIRGYDPRDLLSGHYLNFQVEWHGPTCEERKYRETCLCLSDESPAKAIWNGDCHQLPESCPRLVKGTCDYRGFNSGLNRYYFSENWRGKLAVVPPKATISVSLPKSGRPIIKAFFVDGLPLADWIRQASDKP